MHGAARRRGAIVVAGEMQQTVNDVEREFLGDAGPVFFRLRHRAFGADHDLAMLECDDVGGTAVAEKLFVETSDLSVGDKGD